MKVATTTIQRKLFFIILMAAFVFAAALTLSGKLSSTAAAADATKFQAGNIITDPVFTDKGSMSVAQIQSFLNSKVPSCDTKGAQRSEMNNSGVPDYNGNGSIQRWEWGKKKYGQTTFPCLKDYKKDNKSAAKIIYDTSQEFAINPQVLIVLLQKEQSLVTDTWPLNVQYRTATGYGCPDDEPCDSQYYGLINQLRWSARMFRAILNDSPTWYTPYELGSEQIPWNPNIDDCGYSTVNILNRATQALYNYTPYRPNQAALNAGYGNGNTCSSYGNRNFYLYFTDWFGSTQRVNNIKLMACSGVKYLVERGIDRKRAISAEALAAWEFPSQYFVTDDPACSLPNYEVSLGRVMRSRDSGKVYLVDGGKTYVLNDQSTADAWGISNVATTDFPQLDSASITDNLSTGEVLSRLVSSNNPDRTDVYLIDGSERHEVTGTQTGDTDSLKLIRGYDTSPIDEMSVALLQTLPATDDIDFSFQSDGSWYLLDHAKLKKIADADAWENVVDGPELSDGVLDMFPSQQTVRGGFQRDSRYYKLNGDTVLDRTPDKPVAAVWQVQNEPAVTKLLTDKIIGTSTDINDVYALDGNLRLIKCGDTKFLVERYRKVKREITSEGVTAWGFADKYFFENDRGCTYPTYEMAADQLIRSRGSGKVYYVDNTKAYLVQSRAAAEAWGFGDTSTQTYPMFDAKSITDTLTIVKQLPPPPET